MQGHTLIGEDRDDVVEPVEMSTDGVGLRQLELDVLVGGRAETTAEAVGKGVEVGSEVATGPLTARPISS